MTDPSLPDARDLDALPADTAASLLETLFERAPRFLARLAAARPFSDDAGLVEAARRCATEAPDDELVELLNAHPPIGARPAGMSALSRAEQGFDSGMTAMTPEDQRLHELNAEYERRHGFRFVVFVAGRPRAAIVPVLEARLGAPRDAELRRGVEEVIAIAEDRLSTLRARDAAGPTIGR